MDHGCSIAPGTSSFYCRDCCTWESALTFPIARRPGGAPCSTSAHGSISRTPAVNARWTTDALSHPAHLHSTVGIAAPGNRHLLFLSHAGLAARHAVRRLMDRFHEHLRLTPDGPRMLYRTRHIFILLSGLLHLGIGTYFSYRTPAWRRAMQYVGSWIDFTNTCG